MHIDHSRDVMAKGFKMNKHKSKKRIQEEPSRWAMVRNPLSYLGVLLLFLECCFSIVVIKAEGFVQTLFISLMVVTFLSYVAVLICTAVLRPRALYQPSGSFYESTFSTGRDHLSECELIRELLRAEKEVIASIEELKAKRGQLLEVMIAGSKVLESEEREELLRTAEPYVK